MMFLSLVLVATVPHLSHAAYRTEEHDEFASVKMRRFLEDPGAGDGFSDAMYDPCYPCGPSGFTTTPDLALPELLGVQENGEDFTCSYLYEGFIAGMVPEEECVSSSMFFNVLCGCAANPTISPAPTISVPPSSSPSNSPAPTSGPCFLCGPENPWADIDYDKQVDVSALGGLTPCYVLHDLAYWGLDGGYYFGSDDVLQEEDGFESEPSYNLTCIDVQAYGKECGCPPTEPTISPGPTVSAPPSSTPSTSMAPTVSPCFMCGDENPFAEIDYEKEVNVPVLGGPIPCFILQDLAHYVGFENVFYNADGEEVSGELTCSEVQAYARECGCPMTEPTASPYPTISAPPSSAPSVSPAPTAPCSCESFCDGYNSDCNCWCDFVCESYGDCCGDVKDFCDFSDYEHDSQVEIDFDSLPQEVTAPAAPAPVSPAPATPAPVA